MIPRDEAARGTAIDYVLAVMTERRIKRTSLAHLAGLDPGTVGDFLNGERWPTISTQNAIEAALVIPYGSIERARTAALSGDTPEQTDPGFLSESDTSATVTVVEKGIGAASGQHVVTIKIAALGIEASSTYTDSEDRAQVIADLVREFGLGNVGDR